MQGNPLRNLAAALALAAAPVAAFAQPVPIVGLVELSGNGATVGTNFNNAVKLAVKEINAAGGLVGGRPIEYTSMDTQTNPGIAKALTVKAVDQNAYVILGPVFSGSIMVSMNESRRAEVPNVVGGEAAAITMQGNPYVFRTSFTQAIAMPKVAEYLKDTLKAKSVAVMFVNNDFGKGGRDVIVPELEKLGEAGAMLAVSLHATNDKLRDELVPLNRKWPIEQLIGAGQRFATATGRRVSLEYVMIDGVNDGHEQAQRLAELAAGWLSHVNLIPLNPTPGSRWSGTPRQGIDAFVAVLRQGGVPVTVRDTRGREIDAACGQLHAQLAGRELPRANRAVVGAVTA
jgi:hypothetical protein